jgi:hypothetical protein
MLMLRHLIFLLILSINCSVIQGQITDSSRKKLTFSGYNPELAKAMVRKASIRSAILPGWGQITNKRIWKVPLVWGALGTTGYLFFQNYNQYQDSKEAYRLATDGDPANDMLIKQPYFNVRSQPERIRNFRNAVRQNMDYCVLFFIVFWGLNVADAAVDAHLKSFDISDDLSLQIKAGQSQFSGQTGIRFSISKKK